MTRELSFKAWMAIATAFTRTRSSVHTTSVTGCMSMPKVSRNFDVMM